MKKFRQRILKLKEGYLSRKSEEAFQAYLYANIIFISLIYTITYMVSALVYGILNKEIGICMFIVSTILFFIFTSWKKAFSKVLPISIRILDKLFGKYGLVVSKDDWKRIKKKNIKAYKFVRDKKNIGYCYMTSWVLAIWIEDAKIMYCSIAGKNNCQTAHSVVVKNNCVYDTNLREHYDFDEYIKMYKVEIYTFFEEKEYCTEKFFENVYKDFMDWCAERNVYCDPQKSI